jgi:TPR repeat protein
MSAQDRRFLLLQIREWKDKPVCSCEICCTARSDAPFRAKSIFSSTHCNSAQCQAELAFMLSEGIAFKERSPALVASYEKAVRMGHAEAHASLAWLLMVQPPHSIYRHSPLPAPP